MLRSLLIPLLLLIAQQGVLLHGLSHVGTELTQEQGGKKHSTTPCELCQAFSQIESAETAAVQALLLLPGLSFALQSSPRISSRTANRLGPNNRGPPLFL